jgi:PIN domain nuclease of toxin-antitoxin system
MRILLDTHVWLWVLGDPGRFSRSGLARLRAPGNTYFLSAASTWEIAIKHALGKLRLPPDGIEWVRSRLARTPATPLPIEHAHALRIAELPLRHRDPFDRMLVAQAQVEGLVLMTSDAVFRAYDVDLVGV